MQTKYLFFLIVVLILAGFGMACLQIPVDGFSWWFLALELLALLVCGLLFLLYQRTIRPIRVICHGIDLLREQDYSTQLSKVGQQDADSIVDLFNKLMFQLKESRVHLREQNHFLDLLIQSSPLGVIIFSYDYRITSLNPAALQMLELKSADTLSGLKLSEVDLPLIAGLSKIEMGTSDSIRLADSNIYKCTHASFMDKGFRHPFFLIELMTDEVMRAERKAYEKVIRTIAHEVNNSMACVNSTLETVSDVLLSESQAELGDMLSIASERCLNVSRFITDYAEMVKIPEPVFQSVSLNQYLMSRFSFLETLCTAHAVVLQPDLCDEPLPVRIDPVLWEQALLNIIKNAVESIGHAGTITLRTTANPVTLEIIDTGKGIQNEVAGKLFTPFFSTKINGQGIGLIFVRDVLQKHHCKMALATGKDGLTRFTIRFNTAEKRSAHRD